MDWYKPYGVIINGKLEVGLKVGIHDGVIEDIRINTGPDDPYILSPAFVNAHSHLEYRGMLDKIEHPEYYEWIYELSRLKPLEDPAFVMEQCDLAALENKNTGVAWIGEHSDRPGSAEAMIKHGLGGWLFQEVITSGSTDIQARMAQIENDLRAVKALIKLLDMPPNVIASLDREAGEPANRVSRLSEANKGPSGASLNPHAYFTVNREVLRTFADEIPSSIHLAETVHESNFTRTGTGPLADRRRAHGVEFDVYGKSVVEVLDDLGVLRSGMQCVHCCDVHEHDIEILAKTGVTIAHCPRSNVRLQCPIAPVREFLDAGITVGLGMDSPASGGKIDMFDEMRCALRVSQERGKPLTGEEVWRMATCDGYRSFGPPKTDQWDIVEGSKTPLIKIKLDGARKTGDIIELGRPDRIEWL